jgi:hypothetical protein
MAVMIACGLLLLVGLTAGVAWSGRPFSAPGFDGQLSVVEAARRYAWYATLALIGGVGAGIFVAVRRAGSNRRGLPFPVPG